MHNSRDRERMKARRLFRVEIEITTIKSLCAAHSGANHYTKARKFLLGNFQAARLHRLPRRNQRELGEAVEEVEPFGREIICRRVIGNFGGDLDR